MDEQKNPNIMLESDLPADLKTVAASPIIPSQQQTPPAAGDTLPPYFRGSIAPTLQHDVSLVKTGINPRQANIPLMPPAPSSNPQNNAAIKSIIQSTATTTTDVDPFMHYRGVWSASVSYLINDVVTFNGSLYMAIQSSLNLQPDNNHDSNPAEGSAIGTPAWTLLSENFVFNPTQAGSGAAGFGSFSANKLNSTALGNSGAIGPITTSAVDQIGFLVSCQSSDNVPASWIKIFADGFSDGAYVKTFPTVTTINDTLATSRAAQVALFNGLWNQPLSLSITSVTVVSNVVTCLCANNFIVGTQVTFAGLSGANFLNGSTATITAANAASFQVSFTHANYGPAADSGTAINLPYLQTSGLLTGSSGNPSFTFPNPVKAGSVLIACATSNDTNYVANIIGVVTSKGDSFSVLNNNGFFSGSAFSADIAYAQAAKGGTTTITLNATGPSSALKVCFFEMPGAPLVYQPYDVFEFRGSFFICLKETTLDAFADPTSWGQIAQGTGSIDPLTTNYTAVLADYGRLILNNTSSTFTVNLPAMAPSNSWWAVVAVEQGSGGSITLSPNGNTLDGSSSSRILSDGQSLFVFTDGAVYYSIGGFGIGSAIGGVNSQTVSYAALLGDSGKLISMNGSNLTLTLPNPVPTARWFIAIENLNSTNLTISNNSLTIDGVSGSLTLGQNQGIVIYSDGTNYKTLHGVNRLTVPSIFTVTAPDGSGNVTIGLANENANTALRGPVSGAAGQPSFRQDVPADLPGYVFVSGTTTVSQNGNLRPGGVVAPAGTYSVKVYMVLTQNPSAGTLDVNIGWNDGTAARSATNGSNGMPADISTAATNFAQGLTILEADGVHDITWAFTLT